MYLIQTRDELISDSLKSEYNRAERTHFNFNQYNNIGSENPRLVAFNAVADTGLTLDDIDLFF